MGLFVALCLASAGAPLRSEALEPSSREAPRSSRSGGTDAGGAPEGLDALGELAESVVLRVGDRILTRSELEFEARLVLAASGRVHAAFGALDRETIAAVEEYVINQLLILQEVERLGVFEVGRHEVETELQALEARFPSERFFEVFLQAQDISLDRVRRVLERNLRVRRYLDTRVKMGVNVTDADVESFYRANSDRFAGQAPARAREIVRGYLFEQRYKEAIAKLTRQLREHASVRRVEAPRRFAAIDLTRLKEETSP